MNHPQYYIRPMEEATANKRMTVAAVDLGSNTFRLLVARIDNGKTSVLLKKNSTVQLGRGLATARDFLPTTIARALAALKDFKEEMVRYQVDCCRCCGTEALRKANNVKDFLAPAALIVGVDIEILSGSEEATLSCRGVCTALPEKTAFPLLIVDVGAGSTELIYLRDESAVPLVASLSAGAAFFTELAGTGGFRPAFTAFSNQLSAILNEWSIPTGKISVVATGGTATSLAVLDLSLDRYDAIKVHGHKLLGSGIKKISADLTAMPDAARSILAGLDPGRGNILMAGLEIYQEILATIEVEGMIISDAGFLEGVLLSCLEQNTAVPS